MTLRVKVFLSVALITLVTLVVVSLLARSSILTSFEALQNQQALSVLRRANAALEAEKYVLDELLLPVSSWDETYDYVLRPNRAFEEAVYSNNGFFEDDYSTNYYLILDAEGRRINPISDLVNLDDFSLALDSFLMDVYSESVNTETESYDEPLVCDLVVIDDEVVLVAARALLNTDEDLPPRGVVAMTVPMNEATLAVMSDFSSLDIQFQALQSVTVEPDRPAQASTAPTVFYDEESNKLLASQVMLDFRGSPVASLSVSIPDNTLRAADNAIRTFVASFIVLGVLIGLCAAAVFEILVVRRIARLNLNIESLGNQQASSVLIEGNDEVSILSKKIQEMFLRLQIAENERVQTERLRVSAELAAGVSHNLNNMLNGIIGPTDLLSKTVTEENQRELLELVRKSSGRAARLVSQLNQVVQPKSSSSENPISLNEVVREAVTIAQPRWQDEAAAKGIWIEVKQELGNVSYLYGNEGLLVDVVLNLLFNAIDAMPGGGTVTIRTLNVDGQVCLTVLDTGEGMTDDVQLRVFDPFFTTKLSVGTGLGLATVKTTVDNWGGSISLSSNPGEGSIFTVILPSYEGVNEKPKPSKVLKARSDLQVLLVDDDEAVRQAMRLMLPDYQVTVAASGQEAVDLLEARSFDVALIDLGIPDLAGDEVARYAKQQDSSITTILVTGWYLEDDDPRCTWFDRVMVKPIESSAALVTAVEETLGYSPE